MISWIFLYNDSIGCGSVSELPRATQSRRPQRSSHDRHPAPSPDPGARPANPTRRCPRPATIPGISPSRRGLRTPPRPAHNVLTRPYRSRTLQEPRPPEAPLGPSTCHQPETASKTAQPLDAEINSSATRGIGSEQQETRPRQFLAHGSLRDCAPNRCSGSPQEHGIPSQGHGPTCPLQRRHQCGDDGEERRSASDLMYILLLRGVTGRLDVDLALLACHWRGVAMLERGLASIAGPCVL